MYDQRSVERTKSWFKGKIEYTDNAMDCVIRSYSPDGAKLAVDGLCFLPAAFDLFIPTKNKTCKAQVRWRSMDFVGVSFDQTTTDERTQTLDQLIKDNVKLKRIVAKLTERLAQLGDSA